jgi:hypothetical protein
VEDSTEFEVCPATCLVGRNGVGKTSLLEALYKINPDVIELGEFSVVQEYPRRRRKQYERRADTEPDDAIVTKWELDSAEVDLLEATIGRGSLRSNVVAVRKGYYRGRQWAIDLDEGRVVDHILNSVFSDNACAAEYDGIGSIAELVSVLEQSRPLSRESHNMLEYLNETYPESSAKKWVEARLEEFLPKFAYFSRWHIMDGRISIEDVLKHRDAKELSGPERVFLALLDLGDTTAEELASAESSEELLANLEVASMPIADITDQISDYWSQDRHLRVSFHLHPGKPQDPPPFNKGSVFETRIFDTRNNLTLNFDERSTGFVWFFSFLVWFSQVRREYGDDLVVLLDDIGFGLHARAQWQLLRYISEKLEPKCQVLYTTHSPFMVDPDKLSRVRTVEERTVESESGEKQYLGTKVGSQTLSTDLDILLPLRTALAYQITQALFSGGNTLLVEEPSDLLYLKWFSERLMEKGRVGLDRAWRVIPCGDPGRIGTFIGLFGENGKNVAILLGSPSDEEGNVLKLTDTGLLKNSNVFPISISIGDDVRDVEDLIGRDTYFALVNTCYKLRRKHRMRKTTPPSNSGRVVEEAAEHFRKLPRDVPEFNHYAPAEYLAENGKRLMRKLPNLNDALDRFEKLFAHFNSCLQDDGS